MMRRGSGNGAPGPLAIVVRDEPHAVASVRRAIEAVASASEIPADGILDLKVAVIEAVANALGHGRDGRAAVTLASHDDAVEVEVVARGAFRSSAGLDPTRGRGLR